MTVVNNRSRFGSRAAIHTNLFNCLVSTAPGLLRTTILVIALGPDDKPKGWPLAKAYPRRGFLSKATRDAAHDYIVNAIDQSGHLGTVNIGYALEGVFAVAKERGVIVDYIIAPSAKQSLGQPIESLDAFLKRKYPRPPEE